MEIIREGFKGIIIVVLGIMNFFFLYWLLDGSRAAILIFPLGCGFVIPAEIIADIIWDRFGKRIYEEVMCRICKSWE